MQWRAEGQEAYLKKLMSVDSEYAGRLARFRKDAAAAQRAFEIFQADEKAKADQGWVHCPYCNALWQGSDACPSVTCGTLEANMGEKRAVGVGCGRSFNLRSAKKYVPATAPAASSAQKQPDAPGRVVHAGWNCDLCHKDITGLRIRCMHCPAYNLCLPCLAEHGPDHAAEAEWPGRIDDPHVFEVLHKPVG